MVIWHKKKRKNPTGFRAVPWLYGRNYPHRYLLERSVDGLCSYWYINFHYHNSYHFFSPLGTCSSWKVMFVTKVREKVLLQRVIQITFWGVETRSIRLKRNVSNVVDDLDNSFGTICVECSLGASKLIIIHNSTHHHVYNYTFNNKNFEKSLQCMYKLQEEKFFAHHEMYY